MPINAGKKRKYTKRLTASYPPFGNEQRIVNAVVTATDKILELAALLKKHRNPASRRRSTKLQLAATTLRKSINNLTVDRVTRLQHLLQSIAMRHSFERLDTVRGALAAGKRLETLAVALRDGAKQRSSGTGRPRPS